MLNILARLIFQLIPVACPNHFATGDVYTLLSILKSAPVDANLVLVNQDLAGFFTSIDQDRFVGSWFMLLDFLRPNMNVSDSEAFCVYPGKSNNPGDIIKGRTFRRLNVTRKIIIKDVPDLIRSALNMQTFALGQKCIRQCRGSPMGSPLSPGLMVVVSSSEQIWSITFKQILSNHNLFIRHIRYVDNRLIFGDKRLMDLSPYEVLLDDGFHGKPIILETEPDQEFLGFMLETKPLELKYQGPTNVSQVLSPFSASPPKVLLSGFRSRCHIVIKGAFPDSRVQQGLDQLIHLYTRAGFPKEELHAISSHILTQHQNLQPPMKNRCCPNCSVHSSSALLFRLVFFLPFISSLSLGCDCSFPPLLSLFRFFHAFVIQQLGSNSETSRFFLVLAIMDHAQGRAFHHHLARAIMHMNHLASLLPFFEPSIEWDDPMTDPQLRLGRPTHTSRGLHTFVPLPSTANPPTMVSHGGIPSHVIVNPEPNLRPLTMNRYLQDFTFRDETDYIPGSDTATRNPVANEEHSTTVPPGTTTGPDHPRSTTRITIPVPVRSKQRTTSTEDPWVRVRNPLLVLCLFPSSQKSHVRALPRTTRMMMQHPKPHLHMTTQLATLVEMPQYHLPPPPHHQALPRHWSSHQIPPFASSNLQKLLDLPPTPHSDPGQTLMIKSWSISRMTPNLVRRGRRSALDFVVILRCANWDGGF